MNHYHHLWHAAGTFLLLTLYVLIVTIILTLITIYITERRQ